MRYMLLIYGPEMGPADDGQMPDLQPWTAYTQWLVDTGIYKAGDPLAPSTAATTVRLQDGKRLMMDGPFAETKEVLGGYYIVDCPDLDTALEAAARCPGAATGTIEVRPIFDLEMPDRTDADAATSGVARAGAAGAGIAGAGAAGAGIAGAGAAGAGIAN